MPRSTVPRKKKSSEGIEVPNAKKAQDHNEKRRSLLKVPKRSRLALRNPKAAGGENRTKQSSFA